MSLMPEEHKEHLKKEFAEQLKKPVRIVMFTQEVECQLCAQTRQLVQELAALSDKIKLEIYDFVADADKAKEYAVDKVPAVAVLGEKDYGIRFYGLPYGYELQTLIEDMINVSQEETDLADSTKEKLHEIKNPVHIQVFVTLICPHCPITAVMAHKFAMENGMIRADVIDTTEFTHLAVKYAVIGVPKVVMNEKVEFVGVVPEDIFLEYVLLAAV